MLSNKDKNYSANAALLNQNRTDNDPLEGKYHDGNLEGSDATRSKLLEYSSPKADSYPA